LEINVRYNMGLLSLHLRNFLASEKKGLFKTFYSPGKSFRQFQTEMEQKYPLNLQNAKITSGFFPVTPVSDDTKFGAYILIPG